MQGTHIANAQGDDSRAPPKLAVRDVALRRLLDDFVVQLPEGALDGRKDLVARCLLGRPKDCRLAAGRQQTLVHKDHISHVTDTLSQCRGRKAHPTWPCTIS